MSDAYNPESEIHKEITALQIEANQIAQKRDQAKSDADRKIYQQQLSELENRITILKNKLPG